MSFRDTPADNIAAWKKWHDRKHYGEWADCPHEPCSVTTHQFRQAWT